MLSSLNPVPGFPDYTGPYKVGTVDVEIPVSELHAPSPQPDHTDHIQTVAFRIFYPASLDSKNYNGDRVTWLPMPQRQHISSYTKFVGAGPVLAEVLSYLPRHLHYTSIPAYKNADLLNATTPNGRWPTIFFSHGLGGSRNAYSHTAGSLASHGAVVFCPEHRDGSAVTSFIRNPEKHRQLQEQKRSSRRPVRFFNRSSSSSSSSSSGSSSRSSTPKGVVVPYRRISHDVSPEMYAAREEQMRVRMWEMGLLHQAVLAIDRGDKVTNLNASTLSLDPFVGMMHVHEPGSIVFAGHSFGSATTVQLVKSTFYADHPALREMEKSPLFTPEEGSEIRRQITEKTVTILLDIWVTPLIDPGFTPLFNLAMPAYADTPAAPGGKAILTVLSDQFYKWDDHLRVTARLLSPAPANEAPTADLYKRSTDPSLPPFAEPNFFYVRESAHLSQSDFGVLFPWLIKKMSGAVEPERVMRLNLRAQLQVLRENGVPIARTCAADLFDGVSPDAIFVESAEKKKGGKRDGKGDLMEDKAILAKSGEAIIDHWVWINSPTLFTGSDSESESVEGTDKNKRRVEKTDRDMAEHMEPGLEEAAVVASRA